MPFHFQRQRKRFARLPRHAEPDRPRRVSLILFPEFWRAEWNLDRDVKRNTLRLGGTYRFTSRFHGARRLQPHDRERPANSADNTYPSSSDALRGLSPGTRRPGSLPAVRRQWARRTKPRRRSFCGEAHHGTNRAMARDLPDRQKTSVTPGYAFSRTRDLPCRLYQPPGHPVRGASLCDTSPCVPLGGALCKRHHDTDADVSQRIAGSWRTREPWTAARGSQN